MAEINNRIEEEVRNNLKRLFAEYLIRAGLPLGVVYPDREAYIIPIWAHQLCQLFPQPLPDPNCPKCKGKGWLTEVMELHGMPHGMAVACDCTKPQPLDDKELEKALPIAEMVTMNLELTSHQKYLMRVQRHADHLHYLALLQPKIEEARKQERERIISELEEHCPHTFTTTGTTYKRDCYLCREIIRKGKP